MNLWQWYVIGLAILILICPIGIGTLWLRKAPGLAARPRRFMVLSAQWAIVLLFAMLNFLPVYSVSVAIEGSLTLTSLPSLVSDLRWWIVANVLCLLTGVAVTAYIIVARDAPEPPPPELARRHAWSIDRNLLRKFDTLE